MAPQPLRSNASNVFQSQQTPSQRIGTLGSGRLQNGKLGAGSTGGQNWGFGLGAAGGAPGLSPVSRTNAGLSGFAQAITSSQSQAPLDPSEFPSLGGAPGSQQNNPSAQAFWGNTSSRTPQNPQSQRQQRPGLQTSLSQAVQPPPQSRSRPPESDSHFSQLGSGIDDFPSLGGLGGSEFSSIRGSDGMAQANGTGIASGSTISRSSTLGRMDSVPDRHGQVGERMFSPSNGFSRATPMTKSPQERSDRDAFSAADRNSGGRASQSSHHSFAQQQFPYRTNQPPLDDQHTNDQPHQAQMTDAEKFGLPGLMDILRGNVSETQSALAMGMDLTTFGLDLNSNAPLHKTWAGPFGNPNGAPVVPEFTLPQAYHVQNVPPLEEKIQNFSDDTLFMIFYQMPRDVHQQMAAEELYKRDWRWHKDRRQWMMKCRDAPEPHLLPSRTEERGWYYFWDAVNWQRTRSEFLLNYEDLYHPISPQTVEEAMGSPRV